MNDEREKFFDLFEHVCTRPAMYTGRSSLGSVLAFILGWQIGFAQLERVWPLDGFLDWLCVEHQVYHAGWGTERILIHRHGTAENALKQLPADVRAFWAWLDRHGSSELHARFEMVRVDPVSTTEVYSYEPYSTWPSSMPTTVVETYTPRSAWKPNDA